MPRGIMVNCLDPGPTDIGYANPDTKTTLAARNPGRRWSTPADTARLVAWLMSDEADWITGQASPPTEAGQRSVEPGPAAWRSSPLEVGAYFALRRSFGSPGPRVP
jgi:NAD(P)-dependent dehydrogenase (short-subunit alcohol dehydrogenase family)